MTGAPAQVCGEDGAWHGYPPVCTRLGDDPIRANEQGFDITLITGKGKWMRKSFGCFFFGCLK